MEQIPYNIAKEKAELNRISATISAHWSSIVSDGRRCDLNVLLKRLQSLKGLLEDSNKFTVSGWTIGFQQAIVRNTAMAVAGWARITRCRLPKEYFGVSDFCNQAQGLLIDLTALLVHKADVCEDGAELLKMVQEQISQCNDVFKIRAS